MKANKKVNFYTGLFWLNKKPTTMVVGSGIMRYFFIRNLQLEHKHTLNSCRRKHRQFW